MAQERENRESMSQGVNQSGLPRPTSIPEVFNKPSDRAGPASSAGPAMGETADPNFTAASRDRTDATSDAGVTRMDTGRPTPVADQGNASKDCGCVRDLMTADVAVCEPETQLYYVARMM